MSKCSTKRNLNYLYSILHLSNEKAGSIKSCDLSKVLLLVGVRTDLN